MQQALDPGSEVDKGAELTHRDDAPCHHRAEDDRFPDLDRVLSLAGLEHRAARDDEILAAVLELDDLECVDLPDMVRGLRGPDGIDLRERAEPARAADTDLVAALDVTLDRSFSGK